MMEDDADDDDDDNCAAIKCLKPTGEEVNWVQCDRCEEWYHLLCVGLGADEVTEDEEYECFKCKNRDSALTFVSSNGTPNTEGVVRNSLRESITISTSSGVMTTRETELVTVKDVEITPPEKINTSPQKIVRTQSPIKIQEFCSQKSLAGKVSESAVMKCVSEGGDLLSSVIPGEDIEEELIAMEEDSNHGDTGQDSNHGDTGHEVKDGSPTDSVVVADIMDGMMTRLESPVITTKPSTDEIEEMSPDIESIVQTADES